MKNRKWIVVLAVVAALMIGGLTAEALAGDWLRHQAVVCMAKLGWLDSAARISSKMDEDIALTRAICQGAEAKCEKLLKRPRYGKYGKVAKLYETLQEYPAAIEKMDAQLRSHATQLLKRAGNEYAVEAMCEAFRSLPAQYSLLFTQICIEADEWWEGLNPIIITYYNGLLGKCLRPEAIGRPMYDFVCQELLEEDYRTVGAYCYKLLANDETLIAQMHAFLLERMHTYLQEDNRNSAADLICFLDDYGGVEQISRAVYDHGCSLVAQKKYERAAKYFYILRDIKDPYYYNDTYFMLLQLRMRSLLEAGEFEEAEALIGGYTGEYRKILQAIYQEYCEEE